MRIARTLPATLTVALALALGGGATPAGASPSLSWSQPAEFDAGHTPSAVSCASQSLCVAVDHEGEIQDTLDPTTPKPSWNRYPEDTGRQLNAVSCTSGGPCVAVDGRGYAFVGPTVTAPVWSSNPIDTGRALTGISCPSSSLCVAVDEAGAVLTSEGSASGRWAPAQSIDPGNHLTGVSCASASLCVAVDSAGDVLASTEPKGGETAWHRHTVALGELSGVSCSGETCVAVGASGEALASDDPTAAAPTWSITPIDGGRLDGVSCTASGPAPAELCVAVDGAGSALSSTDPAGANPAWSASSIDPAPLAGVSCVPSSCLAVDTSGSSVATPIPPPEPATPVPPVPPPAAVVEPHPTIGGTPAAGQTLSCRPGTPAGTSAELSYAWLRDQIAIPAAVASTYKVVFQDSAHHLQCQVTATNSGGSATAKSAFVTIPAGGVPASVGETTVGTATFKSGRLGVPIACSPHASGGCEITLRLSVVETLSGRRVVAIAARTKPGARKSTARTKPGVRKSAAALRRVTVTLASTRVRVAAGAHRTVSTTLNATGRRLLAGERHLGTYLYVSGTVIGAIEAQLSRQSLTLGGSSSGVALSFDTAHLTSAPVGRAHAASVLAATPYMGWDTYFALGGNYSESTILTQASRLISLGLAKHGYRYVWLDVGWWHGTRNAAGEITVSPKQWPHGLAWLTRTLHAAGLLVGLYTDAGPNGCGGAAQGSYGHYQQDANTFAAWGFDAVKVDFCGGAEYKLNPTAAYSAFHAALAGNSSRRPMLLSICDFLQPEQYSEGEPPLSESAFTSYTFGPSVGNSWRTDTDVGSPGNVSFVDVLRNMDADAAAPQAAGPGHWNDPDYLAPNQGMNTTQFDTQLSMWSMLAAPLMIGDDLTKIGPSSLAAVSNSEVVAIDQDPAGAQATLLSSNGNGQVWVKPLIGGPRAVALLNRGSSPARIETSASAIGLPPAGAYALRNVWTHKTSTTAGSIGAEVPGDGTVLLRVSSR
jgi:hypothetical protein